jgi:hypothetical protein
MLKLPVVQIETTEDPLQITGITHSSVGMKQNMLVYIPYSEKGPAVLMDTQTSSYMIPVGFFTSDMIDKIKIIQRKVFKRGPTAKKV